jgi:acetyl esterase/lipase
MQTKVRADVMLRPDMLEYAAKAYLATADPTTPLASPLYADLRGLPPLLLQVGTDELLLERRSRNGKDEIDRPDQRWLAQEKDPGKAGRRRGNHHNGNHRSSYPSKKS